MLFQMIAPEYDRLFLNKFSFGLGIKKFLLVTDRKLEIVSSEELLIWNKFKIRLDSNKPAQIDNWNFGWNFFFL